MKQLAANKDGFEVPLTPLVDVVFLLLIFFLVATTFTRKEYDQQVELPGGIQAAAKGVDTADMLVNIRRDGTVVVEGRVIAFKQFGDKVKSWMALATGGKVLVRADSGVDYGQVMRAVEICRKVGVRKLGLPVSVGGGVDE